MVELNEKEDVRGGKQNQSADQRGRFPVWTGRGRDNVGRLLGLTDFLSEIEMDNLTLLISIMFQSVAGLRHSGVEKDRASPV